MEAEIQLRLRFPDFSASSLIRSWLMPGRASSFQKIAVKPMDGQLPDGDWSTMCSGSVVVTAHDSESGRPGSNPEWGLIYYEASIIAQGLPEPSSLRGTRAAEHKGCNWGMQVD